METEAIVFLLLFTIWIDASQDATAQCPAGWTEYGARCYRVEVREWLSYSEAQASCAYRGATLAGLGDTATTQTIISLLNNSWSQSNKCLLQRRDCLTGRDPVRYCSQEPCLSLWVGLVRDTPCGSSCSAGSSQLRAGWRWADGTPYSSAAWGQGQPLDDRVSVRFGVTDGSMGMVLESYDELWRFGFICSRFKNSTVYAGPELPGEGLQEGVESNGLSYPVRIGLAMGLSIGLALLIVIIAVIVVTIRECRSKPRGDVDKLEMRSDIMPIHYPNKRDTIYFSNPEPEPYGMVDAPYGAEDYQDELPYRRAESRA